MNEQSLSLPAIHAVTGQVTAVKRPWQGQVYEVLLLEAANGRFVLKLGHSPEKAAELARECEVLEALRPMAPFVPEPLARATAGDDELFLFTCVEGENLLDQLEGADEARRERIVTDFGRALRRIHGWQPPMPRPTEWLDAALAKAASNQWAQTKVDHSGRFHGADARELLAQVEQWLRPVEPQIVFSHLDYCLPNVIAHQGEIAGVIDWSAGAYADRRVDLAAGAWTIRHNLKEERYVDAFLRGYGYQEGTESLRPYEALWILL
ncbi:MAG: phosphotransferase [Mycobacterium leprae]